MCVVKNRFVVSQTSFSVSLHRMSGKSETERPPISSFLELYAEGFRCCLGDRHRFSIVPNWRRYLGRCTVQPPGSLHLNSLYSSNGRIDLLRQPAGFHFLPGAGDLLHWTRCMCRNAVPASNASNTFNNVSTESHGHPHMAPCTDRSLIPF